MPTVTWKPSEKRYKRPSAGGDRSAEIGVCEGYLRISGTARAPITAVA